MNQRLAAADAALKAGRGEAAIAELIALLDEAPKQPAQVWRVLLQQLYHARRYAEGADWGQKAVQAYPREFEFWNILGVMRRQLKRYPEALAALDQALKLSPGQIATLQNRGNVLLDMGDPVRAESVFTQLTRREPRNAEYHRQLGRALVRQGKREPAIKRFSQSVTLRPDYIDGWLDLSGAYNEAHQSAEAEATLDRGLAANPDNRKLLEAKGLVIRMGGDLTRTEAYLTELAERLPDQAWIQSQLGNAIADRDRERGNLHLRRAVELDPSVNNLIYLIQSLERSRYGDEGAHIEEAYQLARRIPTDAELGAGQTKILTDVLIRVCAYDEAARLGDFRTLGRSWAETDRHTALLKQMARVRTYEDKVELVEQHRIWGRIIEDRVKAFPIRRTPPRAKDGKIRLGLMSSDLRQHPVAYFALPLFDHIDRERFEVYCYSFYQGQEDPLQRRIADQVKAFRWEPDISIRDAAQLIADDQLDMLIELGGSTHMNKLEVMAYRPAEKTASWLGYPHSAGLSTIDYFVCDPYSAPTRPELMIEQPLTMPKTWLALGQVFNDRFTPTLELPSDRNGFITFGTANNPHKYSRDVLRTWARVVAATPGSRFAFIRPEGGTPTFRRNVLAEFAAEGIGEDRVVFHTIRGAHMPFYNEVDITLDPFPLTGGTTTCEALWMGVPVVSIRGEAFYERLSYSILTNAGVGDLCSEDFDGYFRVAQELVADRERRLDYRRNLRQRMRESPLGQGEQWARDFYDMIARVVDA